MTPRFTTRLSFLTTLTGLFLAFPNAVAAQTAWTVGKCTGSADYGAQDVATIQGLECLLANVLASFMTLLGIAAFVMFLIGSFQYLTAGNNSKGVETGKNSITFAIIGIVVALASFLILRFIAGFTGVQTILNFSVVQL